MNLRDKLNAISKPKIKVTPVDAPPEKQFTDCWHGSEHYPAGDFPHAWDVRRETVMLMQGDEMPESFTPERILYQIGRASCRERV